MHCLVWGFIGLGWDLQMAACKDTLLITRSCEKFHCWLETQDAQHC